MLQALGGQTPDMTGEVHCKEPYPLTCMAFYSCYTCLICAYLLQILAHGVADGLRVQSHNRRGEVLYMGFWVARLSVLPSIHHSTASDAIHTSWLFDTVGRAMTENFVGPRVLEIDQVPLLLLYHTGLLVQRGEISSLVLSATHGITERYEPCRISKEEM